MKKLIAGCAHAFDGSWIHSCGFGRVSPGHERGMLQNGERQAELRLPLASLRPGKGAFGRARRQRPHLAAWSLPRSLASPLWLRLKLKEAGNGRNRPV
jgi:hypothetical protein